MSKPGTIPQIGKPIIPQPSEQPVGCARVQCGLRAEVKGNELKLFRGRADSDGTFVLRMDGSTIRIPVAKGEASTLVASRLAEDLKNKGFSVELNSLQSPSLVINPRAPQTASLHQIDGMLDPVRSPKW